MKNYSFTIKNKTKKILLTFLFLGIILSIYPFIFTQEQCPTGISQQQIASSDCVIGADIGSGLAFLFGLFVVIVSAVGLIILYIIKWLNPRLKRN